MTIRWMIQWTILSTSLLAMIVAQTTELNRRNNLDYLDVPTMEHYLNKQTEEKFDVAILFYVQRDQNSHALAPVWDQISRVLKAGTTDSNLIVGVFDCEMDQDHLDICKTVRVKQYPALGYISLAGNHKLRHKQPKHVTIYPANNWRYGEALLDWIASMRLLSKWQRSKNRKKNPHTALPLGIPETSTTANKQHLSELEELRNLTKKATNLVERSANLVDTLLFPVSYAGAVPTMTDSSNHTYADVFRYMESETMWTSSDELAVVISSCATELVLDYCTRVSTDYSEQWVEQLPGDTIQLTEADYDKFQTDLQNHLTAAEPYCLLVDDCILNEFKDQKCRPSSCPFTGDSVACRYLTACLTDSLQKEYAQALDIPLTQTTSSAIAAAKQSSADTTTHSATGSGSTAAQEQQQTQKDPSDTSSATTKKRKWGL